MIVGGVERNPRKGVFRRCNLGNERGARDFTPRSDPLVHQTPTQRHTFSRSAGIQCPPTSSGIYLSEPSQEWPLVDTYHFFPVREALFNTSRKDVHRGQKDSVIGTSDRLRAGKRKPTTSTGSTERIKPGHPVKRLHASTCSLWSGHLLSKTKGGEIRCLLLMETKTL